MEITQEFIDSLQISEMDIIRKISEETGISLRQVVATVGLIKDGNTIPFISRYRKEVTGSLDEVQVREISHKLTYHTNLEERRLEITRSIFNQGKLTDNLLANILKAQTPTELEDLYAPFKKKKKTRGMIAIEKGLSPLAEIIEKENDDKVEEEAVKFINAELGVETIDDAINGAMDIIAENVSHSVENRALIKDFILKEGKLVVKGLKDEATSVYKMYYNYTEPLKTLKPHRVLAINRGEREEELKVDIDYSEEEIISMVTKKYKINNIFMKNAIEDGLKRLLIPAVLREIRSDFTDKADEHGIMTFGLNLKNLLMQPPIKKSRIIGIDPGLRTGSKAAIIDETGKFLEYFTFLNQQVEQAKMLIAEAVKKYKINLIAIGNGTGSYEVQQIVAEAIKDYSLPIQYTVVSEDGASVYSASDIAREEFPDLDLTIRGAISIGRRLQDPLAELVKIDPKSIGVGLYQHDVNQAKLASSLDETVESVVNSVGVDINTASYSLLKYVSGINSIIAKKIVKYRSENGPIKNRKELLKIPGFGEKTFQQAAGFLKVPESDEPLDNTWVHPENYDVARLIMEELKTKGSVSKETKEKIKNQFGVGETTITDIIDELRKPNRDPREDYPAPIMQKGVVEFEDLKVDMKVTGKVKNVVDFGAFVDIGIKETALLHISEMSDTYISNPQEVLKVGDIIEAKIIEIDSIRRRVSLSLKTQGAKAQSGNEGNSGNSSNKKPANNFQKKKKFDYSQYMVD